MIKRREFFKKVFTGSIVALQLTTIAPAYNVLAVGQTTNKTPNKICGVDMTYNIDSHLADKIVKSKDFISNLADFANKHGFTYKEDFNIEKTGNDEYTFKAKDKPDELKIKVSNIKFWQNKQHMSYDVLFDGLYMSENIKTQVPICGNMWKIVIDDRIKISDIDMTHVIDSNLAKEILTSKDFISNLAEFAHKHGFAYKEAFNIEKTGDDEYTFNPKHNPYVYGPKPDELKIKVSNIKFWQNKQHMSYDVLFEGLYMPENINTHLSIINNFWRC